MTIAKDFTSKFAVAIVAVAMILMAVAPSARAATMTTEELQKTINDLLAQVAALQAQAGGTTPAAGKACGTFSMDLKKGANSADVKNLQMFLNSDPDTRVSATGVGSAGMETMAFGSLTMTAVSKFQVKYRAEILTPAGLVNPTGFFGPGSRAQANKLCAGAPAPTPGNGGGTGSTDLQGEADLNDFVTDSADDTTIEEGDTQVDLATFTVNFNNGDAKIDRLDVKLDGSAVGNTETKPWKTFDTLYVMVDGKEVASKDVTSRTNDYISDTSNSGTVRLSGLNIIANEDKDVVITIAADLQKNNNGSNDWKLSADSIRYFDASDVAATESALFDLGGPATADFTIDEAGTQDELIVKTNSSNPDASTLEVKDNAKSDWYTVLKFDIDTKDSTRDITLNDLYVAATTTGGTYANIVDDAKIVIDGTTIDSSNSDVATSNAGNTGTIHFMVDGDVVISAGDRVEAELMLKFKSFTKQVGGAPSLLEGSTVTAGVAAANVAKIDAEGDDTLTGSQLSGSVLGKVMTLRTQGISAAKVSNTSVLTAAGAAVGSKDYVTHTIKVDVTAFNQDLYISKTAATGMTYAKTDSSGSVIAGLASTSVDSFSSTANDTDAPGYFHVAEGDTETFTIVVKFAPMKAWAATGIQLVNLKYAESAVAPTDIWIAVPTKDYRTDAVSTNV